MSSKRPRNAEREILVADFDLIRAMRRGVFVIIGGYDAAPYTTRQSPFSKYDAARNLAFSVAARND